MGERDKVISQLSTPITGENHETLPGCNCGRMQKVSRFFGVSFEESDWRLQSARENGSRENGSKEMSTKESQVKTGVDVVV
jgi:predicted nucleic acid-binding Zn ribbon protein